MYLHLSFHLYSNYANLTVYLDELAEETGRLNYFYPNKPGGTIYDENLTRLPSEPPNPQKKRMSDVEANSSIVTVTKHRLQVLPAIILKMFIKKTLTDTSLNRGLQQMQDSRFWVKAGECHISCWMFAVSLTLIQKKPSCKCLLN